MSPQRIVYGVFSLLLSVCDDNFPVALVDILKIFGSSVWSTLSVYELSIVNFAHDLQSSYAVIKGHLD